MQTNKHYTIEIPEEMMEKNFEILESLMAAVDPRYLDIPIVKIGDLIWCGWYEHSIGNQWIGCYRGQYFYASATHSYLPQRIAEEKARQILQEAGKYEVGLKAFGWKA